MIKYLITVFIILMPLRVIGQNGHQVWSSYCETCHSCEKPTREDPCLTICPRYGGHLQGEHKVDEGPDIVIMDQLVNLYQPVPFAHKLHASMSDMSGGCSFCHHYSEVDKDVPPCRECHEISPAVGDLQQPGLKGAYHRQCIGCHRDWSDETGCIACHEVKKESVISELSLDKSDILGIPHPRITAEQKYVYHTTYEPSPVVTFHHSDHVDQFGLKCVSCHQGDNCGRCHELGHKREKIEHVKTCISCHNEDNCGFCHGTEEKPQFDHTVVIGWALKNRHDEATCHDCHGATKTFHVPSKSCFDCHDWELDSFEHSIVGLELDEDHEDNDCVDCHSDEQYDQLPSCENCHDEIEFPTDLPGEKVN